MSEITMEDYARLAEEIGMVRVSGANIDKAFLSSNVVALDDGVDTLVLGSALPAYLAEPAQFSRILRARLVDRLFRDDGRWKAEKWHGFSRPHDFAIADTPEAAVRDAAALALRERT